MSEMNLADPELELVDPTPNVHSMFVHFDRLFFWTRLMGRAVVRWSTRMYSCAGICSYEGKNGLCDIALSEPLLKLRPRKDLVETLLHEMIHAYLFITNRDNDRDGHGPNFQAHMHRINKAAGLNISIYHDFHDEVKLYLTHWWRCNGICQKMKPYFGTVRRSCNRAPGPHDYWWKKHQQLCGGTFIKIKEPEPKAKPTKAAKKPKGDITKYITNNNNSIVANKTISTKDSSGKENKVSTIINNKKTVVIQKPKEDIEKFIEVGRPRSNSISVVETVRNVWANKKLPKLPGAVENTNNGRKHKMSNVQVNSPPKKLKKIDDYFKATASSVLKDLYGEEFIISQSGDGTKLKAISKDSSKVPPADVFVDCPNCNKQVYSNDINGHLDECLNKDIIRALSQDNTNEEKVSSKNWLDNVKETTYSKAESGTINLDKSNKSDLKNIIDDIKTIPTYKLKSGIKQEARNTQNNKLDNRRDTVLFLGDTTPSNSKDTDTCPSCGTKVNMPLNIHMEECLGFFDNDTTIPEEGQSSFELTDGKDHIKSETDMDNKCPCCDVKIEKPIDEHLDECLSFFDNDTTIPVEGSNSIETIVLDDDDDDIFDESQTFNATGTKTPCPCCMKMIEIDEMNQHLDVCLSL